MAEHTGDCFLVPGPVRMNQKCLDAMATPVITARGPEFRDVMAELNSGLRYAFNLAPSKPEKKTQSWAGDDDYKGNGSFWQWYCSNGDDYCQPI